MDLQIRRIFRPFARVTALFLDKMSIPIKFLLFASILIAFLGAFSFYRFYGNPWSTDLGLLAILFVFLSGLTDEITREFTDIKRKKLSELDKVGLGIDRYSDIILILGALYYLRDFDLYLWNLRLRIEDHAGIGIALFLGIYLVGYASKRRTSKPGWETRAERMFYLSAFMTAGYTHDQFSLYLLGGISSLGVILYLASIYGIMKGYTREHHVGYDVWRFTRPIKYLFLEIFWGVRSLVSFVFRLIMRLYRAKEAMAEVEDQVPVEREYPVQGHNFTALVTNMSSSQPIVNAKVTLKNKETGGTLNNTTNSAGKSDFTGVEEGQYVITVQAEGYKIEEFERFLSMDSGEVFALSRRSSDLSIVVTDADTRMPIGGSEVLLKSDGKEYKSSTDNLGVAYFKELELGIYEINVEASKYHPLNDKIDIARENLKAIELKRAVSPQISAETRHGPPEEHAAPEATTSPDASGEALEGVQERATQVKTDEEPQMITRVLGESALIEFDSKSKLEKAVMEIVDESLNNDREVFIISTQPRTNIYRDKLRPVINSGMVRVFNLAPGDSQTGVNEVPMSNLGSFKPIFEEMPAGSVFIFEALSTLIIKEGGVAAYKFISDTIKHFSAEGLCLVCLLDSESHEESEVSSFENLFVNLVKLEGDKFVLVR
ncbi:MAG: collagen binding domain-containing protein [Candidatus Hydrothermarchaeaceae archaeon]